MTWADEVDNTMTTTAAARQGVEARWEEGHLVEARWVEAWGVDLRVAARWEGGHRVAAHLEEAWGVDLRVEARLEGAWAEDRHVARRPVAGSFDGWCGG